MLRTAWLLSDIEKNRIHFSSPVLQADLIYVAVIFFR